MAYAELLFWGAMLFFILRFAAAEGKERAIYDLMSALFLFFSWIFFAVTPLTGQAETIPFTSAGWLLSLILVVFYLIIMSMFMVRDVVLSRTQPAPVQ